MVFVSPLPGATVVIFSYCTTGLEFWDVFFKMIHLVVPQSGMVEYQNWELIKMAYCFLLDSKNEKR